MAELFMIGGEAKAPPREVVEVSLKAEGPGRAAIEEWFAKEDAPHAKAELAKSGLRPSEVVCTGFKGAMLTSDVQRAVLAKREAAEAAAAEKAEAKTAAATPSAPTDAAPKEG